MQYRSRITILHNTVRALIRPARLKNHQTEQPPTINKTASYRHYYYRTFSRAQHGNRASRMRVVFAERAETTNDEYVLERLPVRAPYTTHYRHVVLVVHDSSVARWRVYHSRTATWWGLFFLYEKKNSSRQRV